MEIIKELKELQPEMQTWRRDIHSHPEIAFEEHRTAKIVAENDNQSNAQKCNMEKCSPIQIKVNENTE